MAAPSATPTRVCFFNRSYWPDTGATGQLLTELAEDLGQAHGFEVTVVTGYPLTHEEALPSRDLHNGVRIVRAAGTRFSPRRFAGRSANYLTYFFSALWAGLRLPKQDISVALTDPPIIGLAALAARPHHGMVFFCQDIFPEVAELLVDYHSPLGNAMLERLNRFLVRRAARIVSLGETMTDRLVAGKGAERSKISVIHNWADTTAIVPSDKRNQFSIAHDLADRFVVLHAGNIGHGQNLDIVIEAAHLLQHRQHVVILFIGDGNRRPALEQMVRDRHLANVRFLPFQPRAQLRWTYASSDVCLVSLKPGLAGYIVPSKLYPILAAGRPYIAAVDQSTEVSTITSRYHCGVLCGPNDAAGLAQAIVALADDPQARLAMGQRAREAAADFARDRQVAKHAELLRSMVRA
jgi:colanic acid biosynthesis glycosyl transferase WcaI